MDPLATQGQGGQPEPAAERAPRPGQGCPVVAVGHGRGRVSSPGGHPV